MEAACRRHDIDDRTRDLLAPHLSGQAWQRGGIVEDSRRLLNAVFWILGTGRSPWRDLPPGYGDRKSTHRRFCRRRGKGAWEGLLEALIAESGSSSP